MQNLTGIIDGKLRLLPPWLLLAIYLIVLGLLAAISFRRRWLTLSGAISAVVLGLVVLWMGGVSAFLVFLFFFLSSSVISKFAKEGERIEKKGSRRDMVQVLANGLPAALCLLAVNFPYLRIPALTAFSAATAEATADTWSGAFGMMSRQEPVSIITFTKVPKGISGGVTAYGFLGGLVASVLVATMAMGTLALSLGVASVVAGSAFLGSVIDSILGATLQVQYRNKEGRATEKKEEDGERNERIRGIPGFDNDMVNLVSGILSASLAFFLATVVS